MLKRKEEGTGEGSTNQESYCNCEKVGRPKGVNEKKRPLGRHERELGKWGGESESLNSGNSA